MSYSGQVQGVSKWGGGPPAAPIAFARSIKGNFAYGAEAVEEYGVGGQVVVGAGTVEAVLDLSDVIGVTAADLAYWFPTTAAVQVASFPSFVVTSGGKQFTVSSGQPGPCTLSLAAGDNLFKAALQAKFAAITPASASAVHVFTSAAGDTNNTITVQWQAGDIGCLSFDVSNGLDAPPMVNPQDTKSTNSLRFPASYQVSQKLPTVTTVLAAELATAQLKADAWTPQDLTIVCGELGTITITDVNMAKFEGELTDGSGVVGYSYSWQLASGTTYNRVAFT